MKTRATLIHEVGPHHALLMELFGAKRADPYSGWRDGRIPGGTNLERSRPVLSAEERFDYLRGACLFPDAPRLLAGVWKAR